MLLLNILVVKDTETIYSHNYLFDHKFICKFISENKCHFFNLMFAVFWNKLLFSAWYDMMYDISTQWWEELWINETKCSKLWHFHTYTWMTLLCIMSNDDSGSFNAQISWLYRVSQKTGNLFWRGYNSSNY